MKRICPECMCATEFGHDSPSTAAERFLHLIGIIDMKYRCNCNAAVFAAFGSIPTTRRRLNLLMRKSYWFTVVAMVLVAGYTLVQAMTK